MSKLFKRFLFVIVGLMGLFILVSVARYFFVDANIYKTRFEKTASDALGMDVQIGGGLKIAFLPGLHVKLHDLHIGNREMDVVSAKEASLAISLLPLIKREVRIRRIALQNPRITVKRDRYGAFNFGKRQAAKETFFTLVLKKISLSDGVFIYQDEESGEGFEMGNFNLDVRRLRHVGVHNAAFMKKLSFTAELTCRNIRVQKLMLSDVKVTCKGKDGIFAFNPVTMRLFGGQGSGSVGVRFSDPVPRYSVRLSLSKFRIEEYLKTLSAKKVAAGSMDFSANLSMQGNTAKELKQTATGEALLRGENLTLYGHDLDREYSRFKSSQNFNLIDVGAFFFAGPIGLAVTKGYNFASLFQGSKGSSSIGMLFSDWKVERGIAQERDVAMATKKNRMALKGGLNFVEERFDNVTIALIDARGCARLQQRIIGPFRKPVVEKPSVPMSLAGPVINLFKKAGNLITDEKCEVFYSGSVTAPK